MLRIDYIVSIMVIQIILNSSYNFIINETNEKQCYNISNL